MRHGWDRATGDRSTAGVNQALRISIDNTTSCYKSTATSPVMVSTQPSLRPATTPKNATPTQSNRRLKYNYSGMPKPQCLKQSPTSLPSLGVFLAARAIPLLPRFQLAQAIHLLQHMLKQLFPANNIQVATNLGVFAGEAVDFALGEATA